MRILHLDSNHPLLLEQLVRAGFTNKEDYSSSKKEVQRYISDFEGVVIRSRFKIDKEFLDAAANLKFIARVGAGLDSIDIPYAASKGVQLIAAPEGNSNAVGEHAIGMLLSLFNNLNRADRQVKQGKWNREENRGVELNGKTVGLIGYGYMGRAIAKMLSGFQCEVICYDIEAGVGDKNASQVSLKTLQKMADVVSLHIPWTSETNAMINSNFINCFAKPFWFINTARGKSVVTADLISALEKGKVLGAGLDVLEYEKLSFESLFSEDEIPSEYKRLLKMDQVILSPHIAGWTRESKASLAQITVDKIIQNFAKISEE